MVSLGWHSIYTQLHSPAYLLSCAAGTCLQTTSGAIRALWNFADETPPANSLQPSAFSWARSLKDAGYHTGFVGKWHVSPTYTPLDFGYQEYVSDEDLRRSSQQYSHDWQKNGYFGDPCPIPLEDSPTHQNAAHVISMIDRYADEPLHIKMDFTEPHLPCNPSEPFASMYPDVPQWHAFEDTLENKPYIQKQMLRNWNTQDMTWEDFKRTVKLYYGYISQVDDAIERVLQHLKDVGQLDNTIIIYTADHGDMCGNRKMMDKHYILYDDVVRVPLVIRYPGYIRPGIRCDQMVMNMLDLVPTILELAGLDVPDNLDGISLIPYLKEQSHPTPRKYALSTYNGQQFGLFTQRMLRNHKWKYIWNLTDVDELYDMQNDPHELHNLVAEPDYQTLLKDFRLEMLHELQKVDDWTIHSAWLHDQLLFNRKL